MRENERRAFDRVSLPFEGRVTFGSQEQELRADIRTKNISPAGGYFIADDCPAIGAQVELYLRWLPEKEDPEITLTLKGVVLRVDHQDDKGCGFAVKFEGTPDSLKA